MSPGRRSRLLPAADVWYRSSRSSRRSQSPLSALTALTSTRLRNEASQSALRQLSSHASLTEFSYTIVFRSATIQQVLRASHRASKCTALPCSLHARRPRSPPLLISPGAGRTQACVSVRCLVRTSHLQARDEGTRPMLLLPLLLHHRRSLRSPQPHVTAPHSRVRPPPHWQPGDSAGGRARFWAVRCPGGP